MTYINPFELLNFESENLADANSVWIKKAKKKLFAEIELSETDSILYNNVPITKSDCDRAIDDLDNAEKKEFHFFIFQNMFLNDFLTRGWLDFFTSYKVESIYKLPVFLDFISPFFSEQYDKVLGENYKTGSLENVRVILSVKPITTETYSEKCFKSIFSFLSDINSQLRVINKEIEENKSPFATKNFNGLLPIIVGKVSVPLLNSLPSYFQNIRNQLAEVLRSLSVDIHNKGQECYESALKINEFARTIAVDGLVAQNILKNYYELKKHYENLLKQKQSEELVKQYSVIFTIYRDYINDVEKLTSQIEKGISSHLTLEFSSLPLWITKNLNIADLNALPDIFDNIRRQIALLLRLLSVEIWNKYSYIEPSIRLVTLAATIKVDNETKTLIDKDLITLRDIKSRTISADKPIAFPKAGITNVDKIVDTNGSGAPIIFGIFILLAIVGFISTFFSSNNSSNEPAPTQLYSNTSSKSGSDSVSLKDNKTTMQTPPTPVYNYPNMPNGNIAGCGKIRSKYNMNLNNKLIVSVGNNADAALKLINYATNKCIRYVYIHKNTTYTLRNIPKGRYYTKIGYGDEWGVLQGKPNCMGEFTLNTLYKKSTDILDFYEYQGYTLKLNVVYSDQNSDQADKSMGQFNSNSTSSSDFYN